jgi:hypothetical protein
VLAGEKIQKRQGIQQVLPFFLQIVQQPQLLDFLHQRGDTIDFAAIVDLFMEVADLAQDPNIITQLTPEQKQHMAAMNPQVQKNANQMQVEQLRGQNKIQEIHAKAQDELATTLTEKAMERTEEGVPLEHAMALAERGQDEKYLQGGMNP